MRAIVATAVLIAFACAPAVVVASAHGRSDVARSRLAPADEYFGRQKESVLEIRNRLDGFDRRSDDEMLEPDTRHALNDLQDAIRDWQHKYPRDPWLPRSMRRLLLDYQRAGSASVPQALDIVAILQAEYPSDGTALSVAQVFGPPEAPVPATISVEGTVVDADSGAPVIGAVVVVNVDDASASGMAPFGATSDDGSFLIADLPAGRVTLIVQPPQDSGYAPRTITVNGSAGDVDAGVIRLSLE